ncbi:Cuticle protein 10.9, partial [Stegodyphus mimosarum]
MLKIILITGLLSVVWGKGYPTHKTTDADEYGLINEDTLRNKQPIHQVQVAVEYDDDDSKKYDLQADDNPQPQMYEQKSIEIFPKRSKESKSSMKLGEKQGNYKGSDSAEEISQKKLSYHAAKVSQEKIEVKSLTRNYASRLSNEPKDTYNAYKSGSRVPSKNAASQKSIGYSSHTEHSDYPSFSHDIQKTKFENPYSPKGGDISTGQQYVDVSFKGHSEPPKYGSGKLSSPQQHQHVSYETGIHPGKYGSSGIYGGYSMYKMNEGDYKKVMLGSNAKYPSPLSQIQSSYLQQPKFYSENSRGNLGIANHEGLGGQYSYQGLSRGLGAQYDYQGVSGGLGRQYGYQGLSGISSGYSKAREIDSGLKSYRSYPHGARSDNALGHQGSTAFKYQNSLGGSGVEYGGIGGTAGVKYGGTVAVNPKYVQSQGTGGSANYHEFKITKSSSSHGISGNKELGLYSSELQSGVHYKGTGSTTGKHLTNSGSKYHGGTSSFGNPGSSIYSEIKPGTEVRNYGIGKSSELAYGNIGNIGGPHLGQKNYGIGSQGIRYSHDEIGKSGIHGNAGTAGYLAGGPTLSAGVNSGYHKTDKNAQFSSYPHQGSIKSAGSEPHNSGYLGLSKEYQGIGGLKQSDNKHQQKLGGTSLRYASEQNGKTTGKGSSVPSDYHTKSEYPTIGETAYLDNKGYRPSYEPKLHQVEQKKIPSSQPKPHSMSSSSSVKSVKGSPKKDNSEYRGIGEIKYEPESKARNEYSPASTQSAGKGQSVKGGSTSQSVKGGSKSDYGDNKGKKSQNQYLPITAVSSGVVNEKPSRSQYAGIKGSDKVPEIEQKELVYEAILGGPGSRNQAHGSSGYGFYPTEGAASPSSSATGYDENHKPMPYEFSYKVNDEEHGAEHYRQEKMDDNGYLTGSYGYKDAHGIYRHVDYQASKDGFKANVRTNEPGTDNEDPADVHFEV